MAWKWRPNKICLRYLKITWHAYRQTARTKYNMATRSEWRAGAQSWRSVWGQTGNTPPLLNTTHVVHINTQRVEVRQLWRNFTPLPHRNHAQAIYCFQHGCYEGCLLLQTHWENNCVSLLKTGKECYCELFEEEYFQTWVVHYHVDLINLKSACGLIQYGVLNHILCTK